jgi:hypothetical protein
MPIPLICPSCKAKLQAPDAALGRVLKCPACKGEVKVIVAAPAPAPKPAAPAPNPAAKAPAAAQKKAADPADSEVFEDFEDFEVVEDKPAGDGSKDFEIVGDEETVEDVEEVEAVEDEGDACERSQLLALREIHLEPGEDNDDDPATPNVYTLYDVEEDRRAGYAHEVQAGGKGARSSRIEVTEGKDDFLVLTVRPAPKDKDAMIEILDGDGKPAGTFKRKPMTPSTKSLWVADHEGEGVFKLVPDPDGGCVVFEGAEGEKVGDVMTESAYEGKKKVRWFRRGWGRYVRFKKALDGRPRDKLLLLAAAVGLDFLETEDEGD